MKTILVTGGAGFLGSMVIQELLKAADQGNAPLGVERVISLDLAPCPIQDSRVESLVGDLSDPELLAQVITPEVVGIYHLAAVLSGGSAENFDLAMQVNVDGTRAILEAARKAGSSPVMVFTSSLAVFGGKVPDVVPGSWAEQPESTYGAFKAMGELLVNEYSRMGFVDARICRLPTISVRPGRPNSAASSFASGIIREPLNGEASVCPVPHETRMWLSSPRRAVANLVHALTIDPDLLPAWRGINVPGIVVTVGEMLESLERIAGPHTRALVTDEPDALITQIVGSWPGEFDVREAEALGFTKDSTFDEMVLQYRQEHLAGS